MDLLGRLYALKKTNPAAKGAHLKQEVHDYAHQERTDAVMGRSIEGDCNRQDYNQDYSDCSHSLSARGSM